MYAKPTLEKFGTFRDLTMLGFLGTSDGYFICGTVTGSNCRRGENQYEIICTVPHSS